MKRFAILCLLASAASAAPPVRTVADLDAEVYRAAMQYAQSQLTDQPQEGVIVSDIELKLFFELPVPQRAVFMVREFSRSRPPGVDGEKGLYRRLMLTRSTLHYGERTSMDKEQSAELFSVLESYSEERLKRFVDYVGGSVANFRESLRYWKREVLERR